MKLSKVGKPSILVVRGREVGASISDVGRDKRQEPCLGDGMDKPHDQTLSGDDPLDAILATYLEAAEAGAPPDRQAFIVAHAEYREGLEEFFASQDEFEQVAQPFRFAPLSHADENPNVSPAEPGERVRYFGEYELLEEIARGGMGVVFKARQIRLNRIVALKMILAGHFASTEDVKRFQVEAENAAALDHPNILPIYEVGKYRGQHYFTMKFITGRSLAADSRSFFQQPRLAARLLSLVCRAVHYAHERGILHRDIKPGNVLLNQQDEPHVTDFGLARLLDDDKGLTVSGAILGSPKYMSPEQARGDKRLTVASDVYGLGAVMYELLSGRPPFDRGSAVELLEQVRTVEPRPLSKVHAPIDRDLETICLKCLRKEPHERYASALAMAEELERWLAGEPIEARPAGIIERSWRWCRRKPALATAAALAIGATLAAVVTLIVALVIVRASSDANATLASQKQALADRERGLRQTVQLEAAKRSFDQATLRMTSEDPARGLLWLARSLAEVSDDGGDILDALRRRITAWAWAYHPLGGMVEHADHSGLLAISADCSTTILALKNGSILRYDLRSGQKHELRTEIQQPTRAFIDPNGKNILLANDRTMQLVDANSGQTLGPKIVAGGADSARIMTASAEGLTALICDPQKNEVWGQNTRTGAILGPAVPGLAYAPLILRRDGKVACGLAAVFVRNAADNRFLILWDVETGKALGPRIENESVVTSISFSPKGNRLIVGTSAGEVRILDIMSGRQVGQAIRQKGPIAAVALSSDEQFALVAADGAGTLWSTQSGGAIGTPVKMDGDLLSAHFDAHGHVAMVVSTKAVQMLRVPTGTPLGLAIRQNGLAAVSLAADGKSVLTASPERSCLWSLAPPIEPLTIRHERSWLAVTNRANDLMVTAGRDNRAQLWNLALKQPVGSPLVHPSTVMAAAFSPDGTLLVTTCADGAVRFWETDSGKLQGSVFDLPQSVVTVAISPRGELLLTGFSTGQTQLWDVKTRQAVGRPMFQPGGLLALAFDPSGTLLATAGGDSTARLWSVTTQQQIGLPLRHDRAVTSVSFSPDGRTVLTSSDDGSARQWEVGTGESLGAALLQPDSVCSAAYSPDGKTIATGCADRFLRLWDASTARPVGLPLDHENRLYAVGFLHDGSAPWGTGENGCTTIWPVQTRMADSVAELQTWLSSVTGRQLDERGIVEWINDGVWRQLRTRYASASDPLAVSHLVKPTLVAAHRAETVPQTSASASDDWPMWGRTPQRNMVAPGKGPPNDWNVESHKNIKWTADLVSQSFFSPVVSGGLVFVGTNNDHPRDPAFTADAGVLMAFRESDGAFLWQRLTSKLETGRANDWPDIGLCSVPYIEGDRLWYCTNRCEVVCLDIGPLLKGKGNPRELWALDMRGRLGVFPHNMTVCSITGWHDMIFVITGNGVDDAHVNVPAPQAPSIVCLEKHSGRLLWSDNSPGRNILHSQFSSPAVAEVRGRGLVIAPLGDAWLYAYDAETGKKVWWFDTNNKDTVYPQTRNEILSTPVIVGTRCYIANGQDPEHGEGPGHLWCIDITRTGDVSAELSDAAKPRADELLRDSFAQVTREPNPNSAVVWRFEQLAPSGSKHVATKDRMNRTISTAAVTNDLLFIPDFSGYLHCFDARTGRQNWVYDLESAIWSSPLIVDGKVYLCTEDGQALIFKASQKLSEPEIHELGEMSHSSPIFANGTLFIKTFQHLFAIGAK